MTAIDFGQRLRELRRGLGYTQEEFAFAIGIKSARYSKYETGRSEPPYELLRRIGRICDVSLDFLVSGDKVAGHMASDPSLNDLKRLIAALPTPAVIYDENNRLSAFNDRYSSTFFARCPGLLRLGTPQEVLVRAWAYSHDYGDVEVDWLVEIRLRQEDEQAQLTEVRLPYHRLHISEKRHSDWRLVLLSDVTRIRDRHALQAAPS